MLSIMNEIDPCLSLPLYVLYEIQNQIFQHGVPSMLMGFSTVVGLELELLAWLSFLDSLWSIPSDLDQILP